jgi:hypothetical protein
MATKEQPRDSSWKIKDFMYGLLALGLGFFLSFSVTNSMQRDKVMQRAATSPAMSQTGQMPPDRPPVDANAAGQAATDAGPLPPGHPPIPGGATGDAPGSLGAPPPLPSLEPHEGSGPKAEAAFKDIEVLRGLPSIDVQRIMGIMTVSLGVDCTYCHVPGSFESPHPKKEIARKMLRMVKTINKDYVGGKVNCYTCHRGSPQPATQ